MEQTLGKHIVTHRKRLGLTQDQLAEKLGVTAQAVSKWENDQSCPDISVLPQLADIFGISTDVLLGRSCEEPVHEAELVEDDNKENEGVHLKKGNWEFSWDSGKKGGIGLAVLVLLVGALYLLSSIFVWDLSFWDILWPSALLVFGLFSLIPKFSFFSLGCTILGGYFLLIKLFPIHPELDSKIIWAVIILLFGFSLLADALQKSKRKGFSMTYTDRSGRVHRGKESNEYTTTEHSFSYNASFGENHQLITLPSLESGEINVSFGNYTVDLSGVETTADACTLDISCSFGELKLLVPNRFTVKPDSSTAFASFSIEGQPSDSPTGQILLDASISFGEICICYI